MEEGPPCAAIRAILRVVTSVPFAVLASCGLLCASAAFGAAGGLHPLIRAVLQGLALLAAVLCADAALRRRRQRQRQDEG